MDFAPPFLALVFFIRLLEICRLWFLLLGLDRFEPVLRQPPVVL
jgi:hypothetical protein